jgi:hypothetical protein
LHFESLKVARIEIERQKRPDSPRRRAFAFGRKNFR